MNIVEEIALLEHTEHREKYYEVFRIEGKTLRFEVDSGAAVSVISTDTVREHFPHKKLQPTNVQLVNFCKTSVKVVGIIAVSVAWRGSLVNLNLYVSTVNREPLVGREWIRQLQLQLTDSINTINDTCVSI